MLCHLQDWVFLASTCSRGWIPNRRHQLHRLQVQLQAQQRQWVTRRPGNLLRVRFEVCCAISMLMLMLSIMAISHGVANPCCLVSCDVWFFQSVDSKIHAQSFLVSRTGRIRWRWIISPQNQDRLRLIQHWWWKFRMLNWYPYNYILNYMAYRCDVR